MCKEKGGSEDDSKNKDSAYLLLMTSICHTAELTIPKLSQNVVVMLE